MAEVVERVWGRADNFDIEFTHKGGTRWEASVPPDTKDGQYACEIWAINEFGKIAYWTGELYMCSGVCCLKVSAKPYKITVQKKEFNFVFKKSGLIMIFEKGCLHA